MKFNQLSYLAALAGSRLAAAQEAHGEGLVGTEMGPVAFMWPSDRPWSATADNTAPCGSTAGVSNRTDFPLCESSDDKCRCNNQRTCCTNLSSAQGSVALSIADDAWNVAFSIAYDNSEYCLFHTSHHILSCSNTIHQTPPRRVSSRSRSLVASRLLSRVTSATRSPTSPGT